MYCIIVQYTKRLHQSYSEGRIRYLVDFFFYLNEGLLKLSNDEHKKFIMWYVCSVVVEVAPKCWNYVGIILLDSRKTNGNPHSYWDLIKHSVMLVLDCHYLFIIPTSWYIWGHDCSIMILGDRGFKCTCMGLKDKACWNYSPRLDKRNICPPSVPFLYFFPSFLFKLLKINKTSKWSSCRDASVLLHLGFVLSRPHFFVLDSHFTGCRNDNRNWEWQIGFLIYLWC